MKTAKTAARIALVFFAFFLITGCEIWIVDDDTAGPIFLDARVNGASYNGTIGSKANEDFELQVSTGETYDLLLTNLTADADLYVYSSPSFTNELSSSVNPSTLDDSIAITSDSERM